MPYQKRKSSEVVGVLILIGFLLMLAGCGGGHPAFPLQTRERRRRSRKRRSLNPSRRKPGVATKVEPNMPTIRRKSRSLQTIYSVNSNQDRRKGSAADTVAAIRSQPIEIGGIIAAREGNVALVEDSAGKGFS